ncbi:MAG: hypothetical protein ACOC9N_02190, partial [Gemmatimonadota bacterium]
MFLVTGDEPAVVARVLRELEAAGAEAEQGRAGDDADLFHHARETRARAVIAVERLPRHGSDAVATEGDDGPLERGLRAAGGPHGTRLVWVTGRGEDDPSIARIRRSGAPYVVLRVAPLVRLEPYDAASRLDGGSPVRVPRDLPVPEHGVAAEPWVAREAAAAALSDEGIGRVMQIGAFGDDAWRQLVSQLGARGEVVGSWHARAAGWL